MIDINPITSTELEEHLVKRKAVKKKSLKNLLDCKFISQGEYLPKNSTGLDPIDEDSSEQLSLANMKLVKLNMGLFKVNNYILFDCYNDYICLILEM